MTSNHSLKARAVLSVEPSSSLVDDKVEIRVSGLEPDQHVTLQARIVSEKGDVFESHAHYIADEDGGVDVCRDSSLGGSYSGIEPTGLLWSMKAAPGQRKGLRLIKRDVTNPFEVEVKCFDDHISPYEGSQQPLLSATFDKWYMANGVKRIVLKDQRFHGTLFIPPGDGPFPGILDLRGGTVGVKENRTSLIASRGFVALTLSYISPGNSGMLPPYLELEYFEEAVEWLCKHPKVLPGGIGLYGNCMGSWIALLLASFRSDVIKAVVAVSPVTMALSQLPAFKYQGKISQTIPGDHSKLITTSDGVISCHAIPKVTEDQGSNSTFSAITPSENISCPVLLIYGTDDQNSRSEFYAEQVYERMKKSGKEHLCSILRYPGAGHLIEPPYSPLCYSSFDPALGLIFGNPHTVWGGEIKAHAQAQEDSWPKVLVFLRRNIAQTKARL